MRIFNAKTPSSKDRKESKLNSFAALRLCDFALNKIMQSNIQNKTRRPEGGEMVDYTTEVPKEWSCSTRCIRSRPNGARSRLPLELQSRQMRLVLGGDQRNAKADVHDAARTIRLDKPVTIEPMRAFPPVKDLITDVSWNFEVKKRIKKFKPRPPDAEDGTWRMQQEDIDRVQEFRKCIECFLCQDVCHVLRDHPQARRIYRSAISRLYRCARDASARYRKSHRGTKGLHGIGYCNITKCCTKVCPEHITITDNAIIPLKERVVDEHYDPLKKLVKLFRKNSFLPTRPPSPNENTQQNTGLRKAAKRRSRPLSFNRRHLAHGRAVCSCDADYRFFCDFGTNTRRFGALFYSVADLGHISSCKAFCLGL